MDPGSMSGQRVVSLQLQRGAPFLSFTLLNACINGYLAEVRGYRKEIATILSLLPFAGLPITFYFVYLADESRAFMPPQTSYPFPPPPPPGAYAGYSGPPPGFPPPPSSLPPPPPAPPKPE
eukprot:Hpha_TRINITY_DN29978_c0_g1::TRINITY_DN29978_c0_g1_i1::g.131825::m.131825